MNMSFARNLKILHKAFWKHISIPLLLFLTPLIINMIAFFITDNAFIYNQSFAPVVTVDILIIGFLVVPIYIKHFNTSVLIVFDGRRNLQKHFFNLTTVLYGFFLSVLFSLYSLLLFFLFSLSDLKHEIVIVGETEPLTKTYEFIFSAATVKCDELGISSYAPKQWPYFILIAFVAYALYTFCAMIFLNFIRDEHILNFVLLIVTFISIADSGFLVSSSMVKQHIAYQIISYFTISVIPLTLCTFFTIGGVNITDTPMLYSTRDFDFSYELIPSYEFNIFLISLAVMFVIYMISFIWCISNPRDRIVANKENPYDEINETLTMKFRTKHKGKLKSIELHKGESIVLNFNNMKEIQHFLKSVRKNYNIFDLYKYRFDEFEGNGAFLSKEIKRLNQYSLSENIIGNFTGYEHKFLHKIKIDFDELLSKSHTLNNYDVHWYDEYFIMIAYLLNIDTKFIILEWINALDENSINAINDLSKKHGKNVIFIINASLNNKYSKKKRNKI